MNEQEEDGGQHLPATQGTRQVAQQQPAGQVADPFGRLRNELGGANAGSVMIESERAVAEAQGQLTLAKKFPRTLTAAHQEFMDACSMPAFAGAAFYSVPRGGGKVTGPSIRFAEELARCYGNFQYGHRELSRSDTKSEVEVFAWDMEKNNRSIRQLTVMHTRDTQQGQVKLRDQKDIDDKIANVASKQVRGRILALVPKQMVEAGIQRCRDTIAGANNMPIGERVRRMADAFAKYGVTVKHIEEYLEHGIDTCTLDELINLTGVYNAIKNDGRKPSEYFGAPKDITAEVKDDGAAKALADRAKSGAAAGPAASPKPSPSPAPSPAPTQAPRRTPAASPKPTPAPTPAPQAEQQQEEGGLEEGGEEGGAPNGGEPGDDDVF